MKLRIFICSSLIAALAACGDNRSDDVSDQAQAQAPAATAQAGLQRTPSVDGASVFFITPADGDTVSSPIRVEFGLEGMTIAKAGDMQPETGHHHLLIDTGLPNMDLPIPADANHVHFGDGSTSTEVTLEPGQHTLQLLLGDYLHIPHEPPVVSGVISITVE